MCWEDDDIEVDNYYRQKATYEESHGHVGSEMYKRDSDDDDDDDDDNDDVDDDQAVVHIYHCRGQNLCK